MKALPCSILVLLLALSGCGDSARYVRPKSPYERSSHAWESTCTITCSDGTTRSLTSRIAREHEPLARPCDYGAAVVRADACETVGVVVQDCGECTAWVESP